MSLGFDQHVVGINIVQLLRIGRMELGILTHTQPPNAWMILQVKECFDFTDSFATTKVMLGWDENIS